MDSDVQVPPESNRLKNIKHILKSEVKVPNYLSRVLKLVDTFGLEKVLEEFTLESDSLSLEGQRYMLSKVLSYLQQCEDIHALMNVIRFLTLWTNPKNKVLFLQEQANESPHGEDYEPWDIFRAKLLVDLSLLDERFPCSPNLKTISQNILRIGAHLMGEQAEGPEKSRLTIQHKEALQKILENHKERIKVETSDLVRELRDSPSDSDSNLMMLESICMQLSQVQSLELQIKFFCQKLQSIFIKICQEMIQTEEKRSEMGKVDRRAEENEKEILLSIAKVLDTLVAPTEYLVKMKNPQNQEQILIYQDREYKKTLQTKCKKLYKSFAFGINAMITRVRSYKLQVTCLRLLKRFYEIFEKHQTVLEDTIITCLQNFAEIEDVKKHKIAALFYYHLLNSFETNEAFKKKLKEAKELEILKFNPHFSSIFYIHQIEQEGPISLAYLHLQSGFQLEHTVQPKQTFKQYYQVTKANSILHYNFITQEYNIGFSVERVGSLKLVSSGWEELNNEEVVRYSICDSHLKPISGSVLLQRPGVYKVVWHNAYSYLKAKVLKYRLRILNRKDLSEEKASETQQLTLEDLFTINELSEREDSTYRALKAIYPDFVPIIRIARPAVNRTRIHQSDQSQGNNPLCSNCPLDQVLVLMIEDNRSYLKIVSSQDQKEEDNMDDSSSSGINVQQLNNKELEQAEYDATKFYSQESLLTQIFIVTDLKDNQATAVNPKSSHFVSSQKARLRDYVIRAEKVLYYTLEKTGFQHKLQQNAEFYFADSCDTLIMSDICDSMTVENQNKHRMSSIYNLSESSLLLFLDKDREYYQVKDITDLGFFDNTHPEQPLDQSVDPTHPQTHKEYFQMVFSYLKIAFNTRAQDIQIYEHDSGSDIEELESVQRTLRDEVLKKAPLLKDIYCLFRKGANTSK